MSGRAAGDNGVRFESGDVGPVGGVVEDFVDQGDWEGVLRGFEEVVPEAEDVGDGGPVWCTR